MVFLDANLLLEIILGREKLQAVIEAVSNQEDTAISMLSVHLVFYFGLIEGIQMPILQKNIEDHHILDLTSEDYLWAKQHCTDNDFEAALQVAIAVRTGCKEFITLDKSIAKKYQQYLAITSVK